MRNYVLIVSLLLAACPAAIAGGPGGCQTGPGVFDYGESRADDEAERLAMQLTDELRAPSVEYERILGDLIRIRESWPYLESVIDGLDWAMNGLSVGLDSELPRQGFDDLNLFYQLVDEDVGSFDVLLTFCDNINPEVLSPIYLAQPEVVFADPLYPTGTRDEITVSIEATAYRYTFVDGPDSCPAGCGCAQTWVVDVEMDGSVTLVSFDEGPPSCTFPNEACCLTSACSTMQLADCLALGGAPGWLDCDGDYDGDGLDGACGDNCLEGFNPDQLDNDGDGEGDICGLDDDDDGVFDDGDGSGTIGDFPCPNGDDFQCDDNCQFVSNPGQFDPDDDGAGSACDCAVFDSNTYPGAPEVHDSLDNQCPGDLGHGVIDEISGASGFNDPGDTTKFTWTPQSGATMYEAVRSDSSDLSGGCTTFQTATARWVDPGSPAPGAVRHYLVRAIAPNLGSFGQDSFGERLAVCP